MERQSDVVNLILYQNKSQPLVFTIQGLMFNKDGGHNVTTKAIAFR
jgi:hypothetical protein